MKAWTETDTSEADDVFRCYLEYAAPLHNHGQTTGRNLWLQMPALTEELAREALTYDWDRFGWAQLDFMHIAMQISRSFREHSLNQVQRDYEDFKHAILHDADVEDSTTDRAESPGT